MKYKLKFFLALLFPVSLLAQDPGVFVWQDTFCNNQLVLINGNFYGPDNPSGTETIPNGAFNGADSIIQIQFTFFQQAHLAIEQVLCAGDTLWVNSQPYHAMRWGWGRKLYLEGLQMAVTALSTLTWRCFSLD